MVVKSNLLEFLAQLDVIDIECWERAAIPIEDQLSEFVIQRGLIKGKL